VTRRFIIEVAEGSDADDFVPGAEARVEVFEIPGKGTAYSFWWFTVIEEVKE
jgi:hypothetical protein